MAVLTALGLAKYNAAVAAKTSINIGSIAFGSNTGPVDSETTDIGWPDFTFDRPHVVIGPDGLHVSVSFAFALPAIAKTHQVGWYDDSNVLIAVDQITVPGASEEMPWKLFNSTLSLASSVEMFTSAVSYPRAAGSTELALNVAKTLERAVKDVTPAAPVGSIVKHTGFVPNAELPVMLVNVANDAQEFELAKNSIPSMSEMFSTWRRFSHSGLNYPSNPAELNGWSLTGDNRVTTNVNSGTYIGLVSPNRFLNFDLDVQISSTSNDDDTNGLVIAFIVDGGVEHTLSALRCVGGNHTGWQLIYNRLQSKPGFADKIIVNKSNTVIWGDGIPHESNGTSGSTVPPYVPSGGWSHASRAIGTRVRVTRLGDRITAQCSDFGSRDLKAETLIDINLNDYPELAVFKQPCSYGYSSWSQVASFWETTQFVDRDNTIYNLMDGKFYQHNGTDWVVSPKGIMEIVGTTKFVHSPINKQTFYIDSTGTYRRVI